MLSETDLNIFTVIGNPISYSQSPSMMNAAFSALNLNACYLRMAVENMDDAIDTIHRLGISGCNITAPFKQMVLPFLYEMDERSKKTGCVNTILRKGNDLTGYNTDVNGIFSSLNQYLDKTEDLFALVVGTGGAARSAIYTATKMKMNVFVCGRDVEKAKKIAADFNVRAIAPDRIQQAANISAVVISTIPKDAGLIKNITFNRFHIVLDSVYPNETLQKQAESNGAIYISAENWLLFQACPAFKIFTAEDAPIKDMETALLNSSKKTYQYFTIIGLSNTKLTEIAQQLSTFFDNKIIDMDGILIPMLALQNLPDDDDKTLLVCGVDQLADKSLSDFVKTHSFTFWIDEGDNHSEIYQKSIPLFAQIADVLLPCYQKTTDEIAAQLLKEISCL